MRGNDLTNMQFGRLKVTNYLGQDSEKYNIWECECKCGNKTTIKGVELMRKTYPRRSCRKCNVTDGRNDIPTFAPWMAKYFKDPQDIYRYPYGSGKKVLVKCPDCGNEKYITVKDLYNHKSIGCVCSDNISYPEKFMFSALTQLEVEFTYQYSPEWIGKKRYDFYVPTQNFIIEVDGGIGHGHDRIFFNSENSAEQLIKVDKYKDKMAKEHGLEVVRINAFPSEFNVIVPEIKAKLGCFFDINAIDFNECEKFALKNLVKEICEIWNQKKSMKYMIENCSISKPTIRSYLKRGAKLGWCDYDVEKQKFNNKLQRSIQFEAYKENLYLGQFNSCVEFASYFNSIQSEVFINPKSMANSIKKNNCYKEILIKRVGSKDEV